MPHPLTMATIVTLGGFILVLLAGLCLLLGLWLILTYRHLHRTVANIEATWQQLTRQLAMRAEKLERQLTRTDVSSDELRDAQEALARYRKAQSVPELIEACAVMGQVLQRLKLDHDAGDQKLALARQFYNDAVMVYNRLAGQFPQRWAARLFGFAPRPYFEYPEHEDEPPERVDKP